MMLRRIWYCMKLWAMCFPVCKKAMRKRNADQIKGIAVAAMTIDHLAWLLFPGYRQELLPLVMHIIGRITCPVMCYFVAEGYHHTRNVDRYTQRLFVFALISHFAYRFASADFVGWRSLIPFLDGQILNQTSVMWSLAWGLVMLRVAESPRIRQEWIKTLLILLICIVTFPGDWSCVASLWILAMGTNRGNFREQMGWMLFYAALYATVYFFALDRLYGLLQMAVVLSIPVLQSYNGERGKMGKAGKWLFYYYYPAHLAVIGWLQYLCRQ